MLDLEGDRRIDIHAEDEWAFRVACRLGHESLVRLLLSLEGDRRIDIHAKDEFAFRFACTEARKSIVHLLLGLEGDRRVDVHSQNDEAFRFACDEKRYKEPWKKPLYMSIIQNLLNDSFDRLPSREVYEEHYKGPEPYDHWVWIHTGLPRRIALMKLR